MSVPRQRHTIPAQRRQEMLRAVRTSPMHVADLARSFGVSEMTVRRDLDALAREGHIERVRGGAVQVSGEQSFDEIVVVRLDAKNRIGAAAAALVEDGQTVMVDIGTTTLQAARHLHGRKITVVTTSMAVYDELVGDADIELILPGVCCAATTARSSACWPRARCASSEPTCSSSAPAASTPASASGTRRWWRCRSSER